jgi:tRNA pseudouridine38-40 synthase
LLLGEHDFSAFGTPPHEDGSTTRTIFSACWFEDGSEIVFEISGNGFLYRMVRRLVSYQVEVAHGSKSVEDLHGLLVGKTGQVVQGLAPAQGLALIEVAYPDDPVARAGAE